MCIDGISGVGAEDQVLQAGLDCCPCACGTLHHRRRGGLVARSTFGDGESEDGPIGIDLGHHSLGIRMGLTSRRGLVGWIAGEGDLVVHLVAGPVLVDIASGGVGAFVLHRNEIDAGDLIAGGAVPDGVVVDTATSPDLGDEMIDS